MLAGKLDRAQALNSGRLPLARLDISPKLVQYFKTALELTGHYGGPSRPPRLPLTDAEHEATKDALSALDATVLA